MNDRKNPSLLAALGRIALGGIAVGGAILAYRNRSKIAQITGPTVARLNATVRDALSTASPANEVPQRALDKAA